MAKQMTAKQYTSTNPIRQCVSAIILDDNTTINDIKVLQNELRRLMREVRDFRTHFDEDDNQIDINPQLVKTVKTVHA